MVDEVSAGLNPARYVAGLGQAALRPGARVFENTHVERIEHASRSGSSGFRLVTSRGDIFANDVFIATSGYTSNATPVLQRKIIPIGSFIIATEGLPEILAHELSPRNRMIYDSKHYLYYYRLTPDNRMLFGGRAAFFPETSNTIRRSAEILRRGMIGVYPQLRETKVEYAWVERWTSASILRPTLAARTECITPWDTRGMAWPWQRIWAQESPNRSAAGSRTIRTRRFRSRVLHLASTMVARGSYRSRAHTTKFLTGSAERSRQLALQF